MNTLKFMIELLATLPELISPSSRLHKLILLQESRTFFNITFSRYHRDFSTFTSNITNKLTSLPREITRKPQNGKTHFKTLAALLRCSPLRQWQSSQISRRHHLWKQGIIENSVLDNCCPLEFFHIFPNFFPPGNHQKTACFLFTLVVIEIN